MTKKKNASRGKAAPNPYLIRAEFDRIGRERDAAIAAVETPKGFSRSGIVVVEETATGVKLAVRLKANYSYTLVPIN